MAEFKLGRLRFVWKGTWVTGTTYVKDDIVRYGGSSFVCVLGHTAELDFNDDLTAEKWQKMTGGLEWQSDPWTPETSYKEGDLVKYGGKVYISTENHVSNSNPTGGFYSDESVGLWDLIADGTEWKGDWSVSTFYKEGDIVKYNALSYLCITSHTSAETITDGLEVDLANWQLYGEGFKWRGTWSPSTRYIVNDVAKYGPNLWICVIPHTSTSEFVQSDWSLFVSGLEFEDSWSPLKDYQEGDIVTYGGYVYVSIAQHINKIPPTEEDFWLLLTTGYNTRGEYSPTQSYKVGDVVRYGGNSYVAVLEVSVGETPYSEPDSWDLVTEGLRWLGEWSDDVESYKIGDAVKYGPSSFICIDEHVPDEEVNSPEQDRDGNFWNSLAEGDEQNVLSRRGDLVTRNAIQNERLAKGVPGTVLKAGLLDLDWSKVGTITRVFYVSTDGVDSPDRGTTLDDPWRTIKYACDLVRTVIVPTIDQPAVINVKTGVYQEIFPISIPRFTSLVGDELRMSIVEPTEETSHLDKFYMRDSTTVRNFTFRGATGAPGTTGFTAENQFGTKRVTGGTWIGLDPGAGPNDESVWVGQRSPYIQNVTTFGEYSIGQKIDGALHNGGNKSITSNDFTQVMSDSIGAWCLNQGRAELVSVFTYYSYIGYLCESGGVIRATNGNNSYGTFGAVSEGVDPTEISRTAEVNNRRLDAQIDSVQTNGASLLYVEYLNAGEEYTTAEYTFTGPGTADLATTTNVVNGGVCEVRVLGDGDNYLGVVNNAQLGTTFDIRLSASDVTVSGGYDGMRITIVDGTGAGQYGIVNRFDGGVKECFVLKESFIPVPVTATTASTNIITASSTATLSEDMPVMFLGTPFGGLNVIGIYYVVEIVSGTEFKVSETEGGTAITLTTGTGNMVVHAAGFDTVVEPVVRNIASITNTNPVRVTTAVPHGFADRFTVTFDGVGGMTELNGNSYFISRINGTQFDLYTSFTLLTSVNGLGFGTYTSGGTATGSQEPTPFLDTTSRYTIEPRPVFSTGEGAAVSAVRTLGIESVISGPGGIYTTPPEVLVAGPDDVLGNTTAQVTTTIRGGVGSVLIQGKGTGYSSAPTLSVVGGGLPTSTTLWTENLVVDLNQDIRTSDRNIYKVTVAGTLGTTEPNHTSSTEENGTATLLYLGRVATVEAEVTQTIRTVELTAGGSGYTSPPSVNIQNGGGNGAIISAQISQVIGSIDVLQGGSGYTSPPSVTLTGGNPLVIAQATAVLSAVVSGITIVEGGSGYKPSTTTVTLSGGGGSSNATVEAVIDFGGYQEGITPGVITSITVINAGSGYQTRPVVIITGDGSDASAISNIIGSVNSINVVNAGRGYQGTPVVNIIGGGGFGATAVATRTGSVNSLTVVDGGTDWTTVPTLTFTGGGGNGAAAIVTSLDGIVKSVTVTDPGENYSSNPAIAVRGGGGSNAILRPRISGLVSTITVLDPGSDYTIDPLISFIGGGNYRSAVAGQRYFANASAAIAIGPTQKVQTLASINRIRDLLKSIVNNTDPTVSYQTAVERVAADNLYEPPESIDDTIDAWSDVIYYTIENDRDLVNAAELLRLNRNFIKIEVRNFLDSSFSGVADVTWDRDIGLIVDAIEKDISNRGVTYSLACGLTQAFLEARTDETELNAATEAINFMIPFFKEIVQNIVVVPTLEFPLNWRGTWQPGITYNENDVVFVNNATYICTITHISNPQFLIDFGVDRWALKVDGQRTIDRVFESGSLRAIENNLNLIKSFLTAVPSSEDFEDAAELILENETYIKAETIAFINNTYVDFDYNQILCARDTGFIVEAIAYDLVTVDADASIGSSATTTGVVARIVVVEGGEGYSKGVEVQITGGGTPETTASALPIIDEFTGAITGFTMVNKGRGYSTAPITVTLNPDPGTGAFARCRLAGSNVSRITIIRPGSGYRAGPFIKLIDPNNTIDARFEVRVANGVLDQPTFLNRGTNYLTADGSVTGDGFADISQTGSFIYVKSLTNVPTPGANIQFAGNDEFYKLVNIREVEGPDGLIGARSLLLANRQFIQEEIISYLDNFVYNVETCERDVGYILAALADDYVFGSNSRFYSVIQQYRRGTYDITDQRFQTAFALEYLRQQIAQSQKPATLASLELLKTLMSENVLSESTAITRIDTNVDIIIDILDNGLSAVPEFVYPDPTGYNTGFFDARRLLLANREFIEAEVIEFITQNYPDIEYDQAICSRDVGYIVDALTYDLTYGGNLMSLLAGNAYYSYAELQIDVNDKAATLAAYNYLRTILGSILQGQAITPLQNDITQDISGTAGSSAAAAFAQDRISNIIVIIDTGTAPATIEPDTSWVDGNLLAARVELLSEKDNIRSAIISFIETNFPTLVFNRSTCSRDIGIIIEAVAWDFIFGSNFQSIKSGMSYYRVNASSVISGISGLGSWLLPLIEWIKNEELYKRLPEVVIPDGNANEFDNNGKDLLVANRQFIAAQGWRYLVNTFEVEINEIVFRQELEQLVIAVANDLAYLGNEETIYFAESFYSGSSLRIPGYNGDAINIKTEYIDTLSFLSGVFQDVVQNNVVTPQAGTPDGLEQNRSLPPGNAGTAVAVGNLVNATFTEIINQSPTTIGITVIPASPSFVNYPGVKLSAKQSVEDSVENLKAAVTDWIEAEFITFDYNREFCYRDVGLIVNAIADDLFGDVAKTIEAGQRYFAATASLVIESQRPQTIAAIDRINTIAQRIIRNETYERTQNNAFQERFPSITQGADADPVIKDRIQILRRIVEYGDTFEQVKQLLLDNKEYIKAEVIAFINASYENLDYDQNLCARDVGLIIDALVYDIYGGFSRSREAGLRYYSTASALIAITEQLDPTVDGILRLRDLALSVIIDEPSEITFQEALSRVPASSTYDKFQISDLIIDDKIRDSVAELLNVIEVGPSALPEGLYSARFQVSPPITVFNTPDHDTPATIRSKYSQVRLTGHDFLNIGTGNKSDTNYPGIPVNLPEQVNEVREIGGGRVFYTSTDQDGNFRVGELFRVEQSTGIATLNADAFNLSGLNELSLGGITLGGTNAIIREFSTDPTFFADSDNIVPTQKAIKTYIQSALGSGGGNIAVNAVIAGQAFLSGDELTTLGNIPFRFTSTGGYFVQSGVESVDPFTGSLVVTGGVGISGNLNVAGDAVANFGTVSAGSIQATPIGTVTRSSGAFTTLTANSVTTVSATTVSDSSSTGALVVTGGVGIGGNLNVAGNFNVASLSASGIDNTPIGAIGRSSGAFTTLAANAQASFTANTASTTTGTGSIVVTGGVGVSGGLNVGGLLNVNGNNVNISLQPTGTGTVTINPATAGTINRMNIGATVAGTGAFTTLTSNSATTFTANTASTTSATGALVVTGGVGIGGAINVGGAAVVTGNGRVASFGVGTDASGTTGEIRATNNITSFFSSDRKFKENIVDIPDALNKVCAIGGKLFEWTDDYIQSHGGEDPYFLQKDDYGVIAQDVQSVFPQAVRERNDGTLAVDYAKLSALAFAAIVELTQEIKKLKGEE